MLPLHRQPWSSCPDYEMTQIDLSSGIKRSRNCLLLIGTGWLTFPTYCLINQRQSSSNQLKYLHGFLTIPTTLNNVQMRPRCYRAPDKVEEGSEFRTTKTDLLSRPQLIILMLIAATFLQLPNMKLVPRCSCTTNQFSLDPSKQDIGVCLPVLQAMLKLMLIIQESPFVLKYRESFSKELSSAKMTPISFRAT